MRSKMPLNDATVFEILNSSASNKNINKINELELRIEVIEALNDDLFKKVESLMEVNKRLVNENLELKYAQENFKINISNDLDRMLNDTYHNSTTTPLPSGNIDYQLNQLMVAPSITTFVDVVNICTSLNARIKNICSILKS